MLHLSLKMLLEAFLAPVNIARDKRALRSRLNSRCTWRWQGCQPYASAAFTTPVREIRLVLISVRG
jgi:hypothetical protein